MKVRGCNCADCECVLQQNLDLHASRRYVYVLVDADEVEEEVEEEVVELSEDDLLQFLDSQEPALQVRPISLLLPEKAC